MYPAETKGIHVASDPSGTFEIWWHRHCNKAVLYFIKNHSKKFRAHVQKAIRDAYWRYAPIYLP